MKIFQTLGMMILYLAIYFIMQVVVGAIFGIVYGIQAAVELGSTASSVEIGEYVGKLMAKNIGYVLLVAAPLTLLIYWLIDRKKRIVEFWNIRAIRWKSVPLLLLMGLSAGVVLGYILHKVSQIDGLEPVFKNYEAFSKDLLSGNFLLLLLSVGILIPMFEEILFRGILMSRLRRTFQLPAAAMIQSVVFGIYHFNMIQSIYAFFFGLLLTYVCLKYNSILASIGVHIGVNSFGVLTKLESVNNVLDTNELLFVIGGFILFIGTIVWVVKRRDPMVWKPTPGQENTAI
jgi:membrane protease YdiL (CAAX protease family)